MNQQIKIAQIELEANKNKNNCLVSNFYNKLNFPALFSVRNRWEKSDKKDKNSWLQSVLTLKLPIRAKDGAKNVKNK